MIIIPMAGLSSRFTREGYTVPKWRLPLAGRPLFDWSILSFSAYFSSEHFVVVYIDQADTGDFIAERMSKIGVVDFRAVPLSGATRGQAETVALALEDSGSTSQPITIFNIDTIRLGYRHSDMTDMVGWLECCKTSGDGWSFVKPSGSDPNIACEVAEKKRISDLCCTGLYRFSSPDVYMNSYEAELSQPQGRELFVAPLYNHIINSGGRVGFGCIEIDQVNFSGVPLEYENLLKNVAELQEFKKWAID